MTKPTSANQTCRILEDMLKTLDLTDEQRNAILDAMNAVRFVVGCKS